MYTCISGSCTHAQTIIVSSELACIVSFSWLRDTLGIVGLVGISWPQKSVT